MNRNMKRKECQKQIIDYTKGKKNRKKEECQKQIIDLMIQIRDVYKKYNADGELLCLSIVGDKLMVNNRYYSEDADHPLDIYCIIK